MLIDAAKAVWTIVSSVSTHARLNEDMFAVVSVEIRARVTDVMRSTARSDD